MSSIVGVERIKGKADLMRIIRIDGDGPQHHHDLWLSRGQAKVLLPALTQLLENWPEQQRGELYEVSLDV